MLTASDDYDSCSTINRYAIPLPQATRFGPSYTNIVSHESNYLGGGGGGGSCLGGEGHRDGKRHAKVTNDEMALDHVLSVVAKR